MKPTVIFVGSFKGAIGDGGVGGQMYACRSLIESPISDHVHWRLIDSTMESVPPPSLARRGWRAARRVVRLTWELIARPRAHVLIFAGDGPSFAEKGLMVLLARALRRRVVLCPRSGMLVDDLQRSRAYRWFIPLVLRRASVVVCQSTEWKDLFTGLVGACPGKFVVIPNWINAEEYGPSREARELRPKQATTALFLGWVERFKGIFELMEAMALRREELTGVRVVVCGSGSELEAVRRMVDERGLTDVVEFRGWVTGEAKRTALEEADLLVLPSYREGMPNAALEAMASALPVVGTRVGGVPALIDDGINGFLVEPGNAADLAAKLVLACRDPARLAAMGRAARLRVLERHDVRKQWRVVLGCIEGHKTS